MPEKFINKYRIDSVRLKHWNYGWSASYFVTICTQNSRCWFGDIIDGEMVLNDMGHIVKSEWIKTFEMRSDMNLTMGEFVVMPNHFHAVIEIGENEYNEQQDTSLPPNAPENTNTFGPQSKNIPAIIRGFKMSVTKKARLINPNFGWQPRFYDHIIRDEESLQKISEYIIDNPLNWSKDQFHK